MVWSFNEVSGLFKGANSRLLLDGKWGIEREAQRVTQDGALAMTPHPSAFGNKLENSEVTTDFSESQLELITPPFASIEETHEYLRELHKRVDKELKNEYMWSLSMPPRLPDEAEIPAARFDDSSEGKEKEIYRSGLANRYGKKMQMISGIHFNFSYGEKLLDSLFQQFGAGMQRSEFVDNAYFAVARNFLRFRWLVIYLFGASPSIDETYYPVMCQELKKIKRCCPECCDPVGSYRQFATSLRVSRFGYSNAVQGRYSVSFNSKKEYIQGIRKLLSIKSTKFERIGVFRDGKQIQLNTNILQKESEFYSSIRLKQVTAKGESQLDAIEKRGVKYAEVRILDVDPFEKEGISLQEMRFLQVFMLFCLLNESEPVHAKELDMINKNHHLVALSGRKPKLMLHRYDGERIAMQQWSMDIFSKLTHIAKLIDAANNSDSYQLCIKAELQKVMDPSLLPSSRMGMQMEEGKEGFVRFGMQKSREHSEKMKMKQNQYRYHPVDNEAVMTVAE